jgi:hypothetical protein
MGLTIHYGLTASPEADAKSLVKAMRSLALDLPFQEVGDIVHLKGKQCDPEYWRGKDGTKSWMTIQAQESVKCPWNKQVSYRVSAAEIIGFETCPANGSEPANIGLCLFPEFIDMEYKVDDDDRFKKKGSDGWPRFDYDKYSNFVRKNGISLANKWKNETRSVPTSLKGWSWSSFCKTQYASNPECGGVTNFLRAHISVVTLLEKIGKLPGVKAKLNDEGEYGPCVNSRGTPEGQKPRYRRHKGLYSPALLAKEVGQWNEMVAAFVGGLGDSIGQSMAAPIKEFANFEQLEFRGAKQKNVGEFLKALASLKKPE